MGTILENVPKNGYNVPIKKQKTVIQKEQKVHRKEGKNMRQKNSSAATSINSSKIPALFNEKVWTAIEPGQTVLDYGCGRYTNHIKKHVEAMGHSYYGFDPYNMDENENIKAMACNPNIVTCSNVLNVIDSDDSMRDVIRECVRMARKIAIFTIYPGDGKGIGRQTKEDCYQRNQRLAYYVRVMETMGYNPEKVGNAIVVRK